MGMLRGVVILVLVVMTTLLGAIPMVPTALFKLILPDGSLKKRVGRMLLGICATWARCINCLIFGISGTRIQTRQDMADDPRGRYILISNHQSWADILVLIASIDPQFPFPRFFMKEQLRWLPFIGLACWALDFPFMKRHSQAEIQANPALRNEDLNTVRQACAIFREVPVSLVNFTEGTRATDVKREASRTPYQTLLPPKAGGTAFAVNAMHEVLDGCIDMSIAYVNTPQPNFWDLLCGRIPEIAVRIRYLAVPQSLAFGDYRSDADYRARFKTWLNELWEDKDAAVTAIQAPNTASRHFARDSCEQSE